MQSKLMEYSHFSQLDMLQAFDYTPLQFIRLRGRARREVKENTSIVYRDRTFGD